MIGDDRFIFSLVCVAYWLIWWGVKRILMYRSKREHGNCCRNLSLSLDTNSSSKC